MDNGQGRASSLDHLDYCCQLVSEQYGKPDILSWTNSDYVKLGYILYKKTHVQISPNTLKRIFGKIKTDVRYYPQRATRDALALYIGYPDWEKFTIAKAVPVPSTGQLPHTIAPPIPKLTTEPRSISLTARKRGVWWLYLLALLLVLASLAAYQIFFTDTVHTPPRLICENPVGENPHSAVFVVRGMDSIEFSKEHYTIVFGDSRTDVSVVAGDSLYSHYYEVPGRYSAILKRDGVGVDTTSVYLKTNGWTATARMMYDTTRVYPIEVPNLFTGGRNSVSTLEASHAGIDTNRTFFVDFINTQVTNIDGDNFDLFVKVKTSPSRPGVRCSQVRVNVFGESSKHLVDAMKPGCVHWTDLQFSEINKQGESNQLNFLGVDLHEGGSMRIKVENKHARVFINSKQVYEITYQKPLKKIYGLGITFSGIGSIESVVLKDLRTGQPFSGNFQ
ncbi:hypothetical protein [Dyadobacter pollutisoli]|uniref:PKD domain-containing protein n=1 Tax=Dyadobacter pollutisoli TaxID=2910158 RepID=A0A9E8NFX3_9BACT|nr:hypothetical protein [Dyadobacter pollutisoli]WAC13542.1 hypothetical protein ON006_06210 [Dyadobacter pollutisoli]